MYSIATNRPMNTALVPTSLSKTSSSRLAAQATRMGPRSRARGRSMPSTRRPASARTSRLATRYPANEMASASLANSSGWMVNVPSRIWILAPVPATSLIDDGSSAGSASSRIPIAPSV